MKTVADVTEWCIGAAAEYGDPSVPVCQLFFRWQTTAGALQDGADPLACSTDGDLLVLHIGTFLPPLPFRVRVGEAAYSADEDEDVLTYGLTFIAPGVWAVNPSLNIPGILHAFVVVYGVPDPAPWERRIILP